MIQSLTIKNYLSIKDEITLSFEPSKDKKFDTYQVVEVIPGVKLLKLGVVYGANASGKSNLLSAFGFLKKIWTHVPSSKSDETGVVPFRFNWESLQSASIFKLVFFLKEKKYTYTLKLSKQVVLYESLAFYPGIQPALIFERKFDNKVSEIEFGAKIKISQVAKNEIKIKCLPNMSFFVAYDQVNINIPELEAMHDWIHRQYLNLINPHTKLVEYAEKMILKEQDTKMKILSYLRKADFNITDAQLLDVEKPLPDFLIDSLANDENVPLNELDKIRRNKAITVKEVSFFHKITNSSGKPEFYSLPKDLQSAGTLRIFGLSVVLLQALKKDAFLAIDEIESKLHPRLIEFVLEEFLRESKQSQLLVATHYDGLLDEDDLLRKDNIWFTEKKADGSTSLYSLSDFNAVNRITSLQKAYKYGKFGAIPNID